MPPLAASVAKYAEPTAPFGRVGSVVIVREGGAAIVMVNCFVALAPAVTCAVKVKVPVVVGVPVMAPVLAFSVKPAGSCRDPEASDQV